MSETGPVRGVLGLWQSTHNELSAAAPVGCSAPPKPVVGCELLRAAGRLVQTKLQR